MGSEPITFKIKTLTPLWTGGADGKMDRIHETGIIGSIRWWYEVIVRGLGYYVCDPTDSDTRCPLEKKDKDNKKKKKYCCSACLLFGFNGYKRRFKISLEHIKLEPSVSEKFKILSGRSHGPNGNRNGGWFINSGYSGSFNINITALDKDFDSILIQLPLKLAANWGALGAKPQLGYGVITFNPEKALSFSLFSDSLRKVISSKKLKAFDIYFRDKTNDSYIYPNLKEIFFAKMRFRSINKDWWKKLKGLKNSNDSALKHWICSGSVPISPTIRNWLRYDDDMSKFWKTEKCNTEEFEKWLFGTIKNGKNASKINISGAYKPTENDDLWEFRIWGWIPSEFKQCDNFNREDTLNKLKEFLSNTKKETWENLLGKSIDSVELYSWREFNSNRDTSNRTYNEISDYIESLIKNTLEVE